MMANEVFRSLYQSTRPESRRTTKSIDAAKMGWGNSAHLKYFSRQRNFGPQPAVKGYEREQRMQTHLTSGFNVIINFDKLLKSKSSMNTSPATTAYLPCTGYAYARAVGYAYAAGYTLMLCLPAQS